MPLIPVCYIWTANKIFNRTWRWRWRRCPKHLLEFICTLKDMTWAFLLLLISGFMCIRFLGSMLTWRLIMNPSKHLWTVVLRALSWVLDALSGESIILECWPACGSEVLHWIWLVCTSLWFFRCGVMRLLDKRFAGEARGVGSCKILGKVHAAQMKLGGSFFAVSLTVLENNDVSLMQLCVKN